MTQILENLEKNAFVLIGKATEMTELFGKFPAQDNGEFKEQMKMIGDDFGTLTRAIFAFE